ncbi:Hypothetical protein MIP_02426 [Mycobacterium intracellulare subsp. intracellulare MTCC 9506]|uniref:PE-PGRS family protein n=1 Tax=Mycobacterium indicus pranii (strain DSM 45239 / MTCC 9506) TaxID=1232724 RepID=J9WBX1_MYCIP|nr:Hypothetical protein MIP_02426 [Mycobacterium intracellulare subsp. intracellulare MTCC 9506]
MASRRLVTVSKRGGVWSAAILAAGEHYLANGNYPPGHFAKRHRGQLVDLEVPVRPTVVAKQPVTPVCSEPSGGGTNKQAPREGLTPTRKLIKDIVDAGGLLEIDTTDDTTSYRSLVGIINRRGMAPDGQEVIMVRGKSYRHVVFRLSSVSDWQTEPPSEVVAAERIARWHPAVASLRSDRRLDSIGKELRGRAFRLLHALAREADARGYAVRVPRQNDRGYAHESTKLSGDLIFKVGDIECSISIWQPQDRVDHTPTREELERQKLYAWDRPPRYDYIPANRLKIAIDTTSHFSSKESWAETKTLSLQTRLPDVMMTFERWAVIDTEGREAERRAEIERRERESREAELARRAYVEHALGEQLKADLDNWELAGRLRRYVVEMAAKVEQLVDLDDRAVASDWLTWCREYTAKCDPLGKPIRRPKITEPGYSEIQEFRRRLGFRSGIW